MCGRWKAKSPPYIWDRLILVVIRRTFVLYLSYTTPNTLSSYWQRGFTFESVFWSSWYKGDEVRASSYQKLVIILAYVCTVMCKLKTEGNLSWCKMSGMRSRLAKCWEDMKVPASFLEAVFDLQPCVTSVIQFRYIYIYYSISISSMGKLYWIDRNNKQR